MSSTGIRKKIEENFDVAEIETNGYWYDIHLKNGKYISIVDQKHRVLGEFFSKEPSDEELMAMHMGTTDEQRNLLKQFSYRSCVINMPLYAALKYISELAKMSESEFLKMAGPRRQIVLDNGETLLSISEPKYHITRSSSYARHLELDFKPWIVTLKIKQLMARFRELCNHEHMEFRAEHAPGFLSLDMYLSTNTYLKIYRYCPDCGFIQFEYSKR